MSHAREAEPTTEPPPSPEAKALRAVGVELDTLGEAVTQLSAGVATLAELGDSDARVLRSIDRNVKEILAAIRPLSDRVGVLESWRGEHERAHTRQ